jgi:hypothetical protein
MCGALAPSSGVEGPYYWRHTGDVETYWMTVGEFRMTFPGRDVPRDLALYDRQLLVAYDESRLILRFDVVRREADVCRLFDDVMEMISRHADLEACGTCEHAAERRIISGGCRGSGGRPAALVNITERCRWRRR